MWKTISGTLPKILAVVPMVLCFSAPVAQGDPKSIPVNMWMDSRQIPLADVYNFPPLESVSGQVPEYRFKFEELCRSDPSADREHGWGGISGRAQIIQGPGAWSVQEQIVSYPGDSWTMGQTADVLFSKLTDKLKNCAETVPGARVSISLPVQHCRFLGRCVELAATVFIPESDVTAHIYLSSPGSSVLELVLWSRGGVTVPWPKPDDLSVLSALNAPLCPAGRC